MTKTSRTILYIDSTDFNQVTYVLFDQAAKKFLMGKYTVNPHESHETLTNLEKFLKKSRHPESQIEKIVVNKGPGSYTGTRIGVTHALALGFAWNVPVQALEKEKFKQVLQKSAK